MRRLFQVLSNMDAQAWRTLAVSFLLFGGVGMVFVFGAPLLGLNGICVICHGRSNAKAISNAIRVAKEFAQGKIGEAVASELGQ